jgi:hypothetical protein
MQVTLDLLFNKALMTLAVGIIGYIIMFPVRKARAEWISLKETTAKIYEELSQQRTNCLTRLQSQGDEQIKLLGKMADTLDGVRVDFKEHTGFIQGLVQSPRRTRAYTKK